MSAERYNVTVFPRGNVTEPLGFSDVDKITLIDDESHGPAAIGATLSGETRVLISSPAIIAVRIDGA